MGVVIGCVSAAVIVSLFFVICVQLDEKMQLALSKRGKWITEKSVWLIGLLDVIVIVLMSILHWQQYSISMFIITLIIIGGMSILAVTDLKKNLIPNKILGILLLLWVAIIGIQIIFSIEKGIALLGISLIGGIVGGVIFLLCYILSRGQMGAGDVKMVFVLGLYMTGERIMGAIFYGVLLCCIYSIVMLCRKKIGLKDGVPMAPFLYVGMCITLFVV